MLIRILKLFLILTIALPLCASAEPVTNWENGFEVDVPDNWLRRDMREQGLKLASEEVRMDIEPFIGMSMDEKIRMLHMLTKQDGHRFKNEHSFALNGLPAHEMVFQTRGKCAKVLIYYVIMDEDQGFLITQWSEDTVSQAFKDGQTIINSFQLKH